MPRENNRLLMELERTIREVNHEALAPALPDVTLEGLQPVLRTVAAARATYLRRLFDLAHEADDGHALSSSQIEEMRALRLTYEELVAGAQALETAVARGYLDVKLARGGDAALSA